MKQDTVAVSPEDIADAERRIRPYIRVTPVFDVPGDGFGIDRPVNLKLELFQHAGSFKARGAFNNLLARQVPAAGVAAASGGNHGAAVAYCAERLGLAANIFVPEIASPAKLARIRACGATMHVGGENYAAALQKCEAFQDKTGAIGIHAYDQKKRTTSTTNRRRERPPPLSEEEDNKHHKQKKRTITTTKRKGQRPPPEEDNHHR